MAFANDKPARNITWPPGASTGSTRMVVGADTPSELVSYGISVAMLFYVKDFPTNVEVGYFFIGLSNILDDGNDNVLLYGQVVYPVPGVPSSAGVANVKTNFQQGLGDPGTASNQSTRFKDFNFVIDNSVPFFQLNPAISSLVSAPVEMRAAADVTYVGWPIGARKIKRKAVTQDYTNMADINNFDQDLFFDDLDLGKYHIELHLFLIGGAAQDIRTSYVFSGIGSGTRGVQGPTFTAGSYTSRQNTALRLDSVAFGSEIGYSMSDSVNATYVVEVIDAVVTTAPATLYLRHRQSALDAANTGVIAGSRIICERYE